jgi:hypothetical protein
MYDIQKDVPVPKLKRSRLPVRKKYKFEQMAVGDFFFVPNRAKNTMGTHTSSVSKKLGIKLITRMMFMRETLEGWVECAPDAENAVRGIGVWRVAKEEPAPQP